MTNKRTTNTEDVTQLTRDMREKLANKVIDGCADAFLKIKAHKDDIAKLHGEVAKIRKEPRSAQNNYGYISDCRTWGQFCDRKLHRDIRTIQRLLEVDRDKTSRAKSDKQKADSADRSARRIMAATDKKAELAKAELADKIDETLTDHEAALRRESERVIGRDFPAAPTKNWDSVIALVTGTLGHVLTNYRDRGSLGYNLKEIMEHRADVSKEAMTKLTNALTKLSEEALALVSKLEDQRRAA